MGLEFGVFLPFFQAISLILQLKFLYDLERIRDKSISSLNRPLKACEEARSGC